MPLKYKSTNDSVIAAAARAGSASGHVWAAIRKKFGRVTGASEEKRAEIEAFLDTHFPAGATLEAVESVSFSSGEMTHSEAGERLCWRGITDNGMCNPSLCMAWRVTRIFDEEGVETSLERRNDSGMIVLGRCAALRE